jgi:anthranilate synthase component 1
MRPALDPAAAVATLDSAVDRIDPALVFERLFAHEPLAFWLDAGPDATEGRSYLGSGVELVGSLAELRARLRPGEVWVGWLGYEARAETMGEPVLRAERYPRVALMRAETVLEFDHASGRATWLGAAPSPAVRGIVADLGRGAAASEPAEGRAASVPALTATWADSDEDYLAKIEACQRAIAEGDAYQLCLTTESRVDAPIDPLATYRRLRASSPSHHGGFLRVGEVALLSSSPERFLSVDADRTISSSPIKGTRPRGATAALDEALAAELEASEKERAENLMIVDLVRNDLARVCEVGSVTVTRLLEVESYPAVHQLVSEIVGRLRSDVGVLDAIAATFPAGSMTGAPKHSATRILDRLEQRARGIYAGAFGWIGGNDTADLAMVIRSIVTDAAGATIGSGGGITASSVPAEELAEVKLKAAALLAALGATG